MEGGFRLGIAVLCGIIVLSFFLPWVQVESSQLGALTELIAGKSQKNIASVTGLQIPLMANSENSRLIVKIAQIFNPGVKGVDKKSFLVLAVPGFAILVLVLCSLYGNKKWVILTWSLLSILIFAAALYKIKSTDLEKAVLQIRIGFGLWLILYSYLFMGILGIAGFLKITAKGRK
ncbi:MAG: hypothetical protein GF375_04400 [Candidatus Omnitrophica bacterium]|nr:hypothetical protein [Candidatus Omnitrophota bacterium]